MPAAIAAAVREPRGRLARCCIRTDDTVASFLSSAAEHPSEGRDSLLTRELNSGIVGPFDEASAARDSSRAPDEIVDLDPRGRPARGACTGGHRSELTYWYEAPTSGYAGLLELTPAGFARLYPGLWQREGDGQTSGRPRNDSAEAQSRSVAATQRWRSSNQSRARCESLFVEVSAEAAASF